MSCIHCCVHGCDRWGCFYMYVSACAYMWRVVYLLTDRLETPLRLGGGGVSPLIGTNASDFISILPTTATTMCKSMCPCKRRKWVEWELFCYCSLSLVLEAGDTSAFDGMRTFEPAVSLCVRSSLSTTVMNICRCLHFSFVLFFFFLEPFVSTAQDYIHAYML